MKQNELIAAKYEGREIPRPPHWSGIRVIPERIEFWESGDFRLHNRWEFRTVPDGWNIERLNP